MNAIRPALLWLLFAGTAALGQDPATPPPRPPDELLPLSPGDGARLSAAALEQLVAPIALYPDALIALILPASTAPADIVLAARQLRESGADRSQIDHRAWDESVKSLTFYADVLKWMDENLQWTKQLGEAFLAQPAEVMQAVQRLRAKARAEGKLVDTPQQQVLADLEVIRIVPAQADAIYVPYYEPATIFFGDPIGYGRPPVLFGVGMPVGAWLAFECDWRRHTIWMGNRHRHWSGHDWRQPVVPIPIAGPAYARHPDVRAWRPSPDSPRPPRSTPRPESVGIARPRPPAYQPEGSDPGRVITYRSPGPPRRDRPAAAPTQGNPGPTGASFAPAASSATYAVAPASTTTPETSSTSPTTTVRRAPPPGERDAGSVPAGSSPPRRHPSETRAAPASTPSTTNVAPPPTSTPRQYSRPPAAAPSTAPSSPPAVAPSRPSPPASSRPEPQSRPQSAPASAPTNPPASAPARTEVDGDRSAGRRATNER